MPVAQLLDLESQGEMNSEHMKTDRIPSRGQRRRGAAGVKCLLSTPRHLVAIRHSFSQGVEVEATGSGRVARGAWPRGAWKVGGGFSQHSGQHRGELLP